MGMRLTTTSSSALKFLCERERERERERGEKGELGLTTKRSYERACEGRWRIV
jgi:hypothetical protein